MSCGDDGLALGKLFEKQTDVGRLHYFQKFVRGIVLKSAHGGGGIVEGDAFLRQELYQVFLIESLLAGKEEMLLVIKKEKSEDSPHVILQVGVKEIHAPTFLLWRKAA